MKIEVTRYSIKIIPENVQDEAFIEEVLGMKNGAPNGTVERKNVMSTSSLAYVEIKK